MLRSSYFQKHPSWQYITLMRIFSVVGASVTLKRTLMMQLHTDFIRYNEWSGFSVLMCTKPNDNTSLSAVNHRLAVVKEIRLWCLDVKVASLNLPTADQVSHLAAQRLLRSPTFVTERIKETKGLRE